MADPSPLFEAVVRPDFNKTALDLIKTYEETPGSTRPGCCPEAVAEVILLLVEVLKKLSHSKVSIASLFFSAYSLQGLSEEKAAEKAKKAAGIE